MTAENSTPVFIFNSNICICSYNYTIRYDNNVYKDNDNNELKKLSKLINHENISLQANRKSYEAT